MTAETRIEPCGTVVYASLHVPHDWSPQPLNPQGDIIGFHKKIGPLWRDGRRYEQNWIGHRFSDGSVCNGKCAE